MPAGGLFTGAEGIKTPEQEPLYGGVAGMPYDPCYHQACDTIFNLNHTALDQMSDAAAHAAWTLARSKSPITVAQPALPRRPRSATAQGEGEQAHEGPALQGPPPDPLSVFGQGVSA